jgi:tetratricopeptide (TPR) repeat protein
MKAASTGPGGNRQRIFFWVVLALFPFLLLALTEGLLRLTGKGAPPPLFRQASGQGVDGYVTNPDVGARYFPPAMRANMPKLGFQYFPRRKAPGTFRYFSLGGSATAGFPYHSHASFSGLLAVQLQQLFPDRPIESVNCAMTAVNSHTALDFVSEILEHEPDLIVVYMGHNEFYGAGGVGSATALGRHPWAVRWTRRLLSLRLTGVLRSALKIGYARTTDAPGQNVMETMAAEREIPFGSPLRKAAAEIYERNLSQLVRRCEKRGVPVVLCEVSSNLRGQAPFGSAFRKGFGEHARFEALLREAGEKRQSGDFNGAVASIDKAIALDSTFAAARFEKGRILDLLGQPDLALGEYRAARDMDTVPFRAPTEINRVIRRVADAYKIPLVSVDSVIAAGSPGGIPGDEFFLEHLHFNLRGNEAVAQALAERICQEGWIAPPEQWRWSQALPPAEQAQRAGVTDLDLEIGDQRVFMLKQRWPYVAQGGGKPAPYLSKRDPKVVETAAAFIRKRIELNEAHNELGRYYAEKGEYQLGLAECLSSFRMFPLDPAPATEAAELWLRVGRPDEAGPLLARALELQPDSERALLLLAQAYWQTGNMDGARRMLTRALEINPRSRAALTLKDRFSAETARQGVGIR